MGRFPPHGAGLAPALSAHRSVRAAWWEHRARGPPRDAGSPSASCGKAGGGGAGKKWVWARPRQPWPLCPTSAAAVGWGQAQWQSQAGRFGSNHPCFSTAGSGRVSRPWGVPGAGSFPAPRGSGQVEKSHVVWAAQGVRGGQALRLRTTARRLLRRCRLPASGTVDPRASQLRRLFLAALMISHPPTLEIKMSPWKSAAGTSLHPRVPAAALRRGNRAGRGRLRGVRDGCEEGFLLTLRRQLMRWGASWYRTGRLLAAQPRCQPSAGSIYGASGCGLALASPAGSGVLCRHPPMYHAMVDFSERYLER